MADLLGCPFCGGDAESDSQRHYRNISTGNLEKSAAIYCTKCNADMTWCYLDTPEIEREQVMLLLTEQWNTRATLSQPTADRREIVARIIDPTAFSCTPKVYGLKNQAELEKLTMVGAARRIAREKATKILTALDGGRDA